LCRYKLALTDTSETTPPSLRYRSAGGNDDNDDDVDVLCMDCEGRLYHNVDGDRDNGLRVARHRAGDLLRERQRNG